MSNPVPIIFTNGIRLVMKTSISDPPGILYLLISTCSSVRGSNLSFTLAAHFRVIPFFSRMVLSSVMVSQKEWAPLLKVRLNAPEANLFLFVPQIWGFCCKYYDKMLENRALEQ